jgi:signal transduction histidine kinase
MGYTGMISCWDQALYTEELVTQGSLHLMFTPHTKTIMNDLGHGYKTDGSPVPPQPFPAISGTFSRDTGKGTRYACKTLSTPCIPRPKIILMKPLSSPSLWLPLAQVLQILIICLTIGLFIVSIPINYEQRSVICKIESCPPDQVTLAGEQAMNHVGISTTSFVTLTIALDVLVAVIFTTCAIIIFVRKPNDPFTIFVTVMLVTFGLATFTGAIRGIALAYPKLDWLVKTIEMIGNTSIPAFFFVFPNGRFTPRWTAAILIGWLLLILPPYYFPDSPLNLQHNPAIFGPLFVIVHLSGIVAQIHRYRRISGSIEKQQTKWVVYGLTIGVGAALITKLLALTITDPMGDGLPLIFVFNIVAVLWMLLLPISITIAVVRYRLWDINPIINRTLVYGALSFLTIAFYVLIVGGFALYFRSNETNLVISFIATGIVAILFEPLRQRLQRAVNRLMYGERDDPATVLTRLSQRLDSALAPDSVLQTIAETLAQTLRLPYAAISLVEDAPRFASTSSPPPSDLHHLPLHYQTERVGELILAPRAPDESFSPADMKLINIIAQQAGVAAYTVRLNNDLQRSRERLVTAQEEERRRLRRDLHDGVGPTLASFSQRLETAAELIHTDPHKSEKIIHALQKQVTETVADIRRLVYALRPPVLDEFGLVSAVREHVAQYSGPRGIKVSFDVSEPMPSLPAAVEVAAYRIALEAFTNVVKHAKASACHVLIRVENASLLLEISDNGKGLPAEIHAGIGFHSMRERASELGGEFSIEKKPSGGTMVRARLPIMNLANLPAMLPEQNSALSTKENRPCPSKS